MSNQSLLHGANKWSISFTKVIAIMVLAVNSLTMPTVWASGDDDHERARQALQSGQILPLRTVLERLERSHPGKVLEVELEQKDGLWIYKVKLLQADGQLVKLMLDAKIAVIIERKNRGVTDRQKLEKTR